MTSFATMLGSSCPPCAGHPTGKGFEPRMEEADGLGWGAIGRAFMAGSTFVPRMLRGTQ
jgi:hypothetical protein